MSLDASKHLYDARVDPKRRVHGVGVYQTVLDQWGIPYDQPLPLLRRQVGAALEGVVRQRVTPIRSLAVDTHGHTYYGSGSPSFSALICTLAGTTCAVNGCMCLATGHRNLAWSRCS